MNAQNWIWKSKINWRLKIQHKWNAWSSEYSRYLHVTYTHEWVHSFKHSLGMVSTVKKYQSYLFFKDFTNDYIFSYCNNEKLHSRWKSALNGPGVLNARVLKLFLFKILTMSPAEKRSGCLCGLHDYIHDWPI